VQQDEKHLPAFFTAAAVAAAAAETERAEARYRISTRRLSSFVRRRFVRVQSPAGRQTMRALSAVVMARAGSNGGGA